MPHPDAEHSLRIQLATALRENERVQEALGDAFKELREVQSALAAARRECEALRKRDDVARAMLTELRAALDDDATFLGAVLRVEMDKWLAAPAAAADGEQGKEPRRP